MWTKSANTSNVGQGQQRQSELDYRGRSECGQKQQIEWLDISRIQAHHIRLPAIDILIPQLTLI